MFAVAEFDVAYEVLDDCFMLVLNLSILFRVARKLRGGKADPKRKGPENVVF